MIEGLGRTLLFNGAMADQSTHVWSVVNPRGNNQKVMVDNNVWSDYQMTLALFGRDTDIYVNNTVFKAVPSYPGGVFFNGFMWGGGSWMGTIDSLSITNSSIMNTWGEALVVYEQVSYGMVDHVTFANIVMDPIWYRGGNNMTFKNNLMFEVDRSAYRSCGSCRGNAFWRLVGGRVGFSEGHGLEIDPGLDPVAIEATTDAERWWQAYRPTEPQIFTSGVPLGDDWPDSDMDGYRGAIGPQ